MVTSKKNMLIYRFRASAIQRIPQLVLDDDRHDRILGALVVMDDGTIPRDARFRAEKM